MQRRSLPPIGFRVAHRLNCAMSFNEPLAGLWRCGAQSAWRSDEEPIAPVRPDERVGRASPGFPDTSNAMMCLGGKHAKDLVFSYWQSGNGDPLQVTWADAHHLPLRVNDVRTICQVQPNAGDISISYQIDGG